MKRLRSIVTASLIFSWMIAGPAYAKDKGEKADPGGPSAGDSASPGGKSESGNGQGSGSGRDGRGTGKAGAGAARPGAAAQAQAGSPQLAGVKAGTKANVVEVNDLIKGTRRAALNKSLSANQAGIDRLRSTLVRLGLSGLDARDAGDAIATRREPDGSLTVFVDRGAN